MTEATPSRAALARGVVTIDIVSDVVCPWCYLGKRRLEAAIAAAKTPVEIHWRPYQLDPTVPPMGIDRQTYLAAKFDDPAKLEAVHSHLKQAGVASGVDFAFERIAKAPNSLDAHRLIRWSAAADQQGEIVDALFRAFFTEGRDIGDRKVLVEIAAAQGLDATLVHRLLASGADETETREEIASAVRLGVTGVPFFIFAGRYAVPGAQDPRVLAGAIGKARNEGMKASERRGPGPDLTAR